MAGTQTTLLFRRLARRNRMVSVLRIGLPVGGLVILVGLIAQIYIASFAGRFGVGRIEITPEHIIIDTPEYSGTLDDGSAYRVWADTATAAVSRTDLMDLDNAHLVVDRIDGVQIRMAASYAQIDTTSQLTTVPGLADVADSKGMVGTLADAIIDWNTQQLTANGPVFVEQADGTTVKAEGLDYDASTAVWTFRRSVVTLPSTPGENANSDSED